MANSTKRAVSTSLSAGSSKLADGEVIAEDIPSVKHFATLEEIYSWLSSAGFIVEEVYGDYNYNPIGEKTNRAIIWAKKA